MTTAVSLARYDRSIVVFYIKIRSSVPDGIITNTVSMGCPLGGTHYFRESYMALERALTSGDANALERCSNILVSPGEGDLVDVQCGSFNVFGEPHELASGLKVRMPRVVWQQALAAMKRALTETPEPLV
jgi:hypothetical protein